MITTEILKAHRACARQLEIFNKLFPNGAEITDENWELAKRAGLPPEWCKRLLTDKALAEYLKIKQPAYAEHLKIEQSAYAEYQKIKQSAYAEYLKIEQSAYAEYQKIKQSVLLAALKEQYK